MKKVFVALAIAAALPSLAASKKPEVSGLELQQIQSKEYDVSKGVAFASVMTVLQDAGYRIGSAEKETGLITGVGSSSKKLTWMPFVGFGSAKKNPVVSAYIEERGANRSRVRLNFVMAKVSSNMYVSNSDETPILDPSTYKEAFEKIEKEIFVRSAMDAPVPAATMAAAATGEAVPPMQAAVTKAVGGQVLPAASTATPQR